MAAGRRWHTPRDRWLPQRDPAGLDTGSVMYPAGTAATLGNLVRDGFRWVVMAGNRGVQAFFRLMGRKPR